MKRIFALFLCLCLPVYAATKYCTPAGAGTHSGADWANAYDFSEAINSGNVSAGDTVYCDGSFGDLAIVTNTDATGATGNPITYSWDGITAVPNCTQLDIGGTSSGYYTFSGFTIDVGVGDTNKTAVILDATSACEITFSSCTLSGQRTNTYAGGEFTPYYVATGVWENMYVVDCTNSGITLTIQNCTSIHGWRFLRATNLGICDITVSGCTFDRLGEDALNFAGTTTGVTVTGCTFGGTSPLDNRYSAWWWPGTATGTWAGHEGETITQDTTSDTAIFVAVSGGRLYVLPNATATFPTRTNQQVWRLDSDPTNIYWTPSENGDNAHNDAVSIETTGSSYLVEKCFFDGTTGMTGQQVKVSNASVSGVVIRNNIFDRQNGTYALLIENGGNGTYVYNNLFRAVSGSGAHCIRTIAGADIEIVNNILTGGVDSGGTVFEDYNIYDDAAPIWDTNANGLQSQDFTDAGSPRYFTNWTTGDYTTYNTSSPQVDAASATYAPADDYSGNTRFRGLADDIGPYEITFQPTAQPTSIIFTNVTDNGMTISWTTGDGLGEIVVVSGVSAVISDPADGTEYTPSTTYGSGGTTGADDYVVYYSTSNTVNVTGMAASTTYYVEIFAYNGVSDSVDYLVTSPLAGNQATSAASTVPMIILFNLEQMLGGMDE